MEKNNQGSGSPKLTYSKQKQTGRKMIKTGKVDLTKKERELQKNAESLLQYSNFAVIRVPDSAYSAIFSNPNLPMKDRGFIAEYLRGIPDLVIMRPIEGTIFNLAICTELKSKTGNASKGQKKFAEKANVIDVRSFESFEKIFKILTETKLKKEIFLYGKI